MPEPKDGDRLDPEEQALLSEATAPNRSPEPEVQEKAERVAEGRHPLDTDTQDEEKER